jgi:hypothetical protein
MSATEIAKLHFSAAIAEAKAAGLDHDSVCRSLLGLVVSKYLETRNAATSSRSFALSQTTAIPRLTSSLCVPKASCLESAFCALRAGASIDLESRSTELEGRQPTDQPAFAIPTSSGDSRYIPDMGSTQHRWS